MKALFIANIPSPYRIDFYQALGKLCDLTVVFEAKGSKSLKFNYNFNRELTFKAVFLNNDSVTDGYYRVVNRKIKPILSEHYDKIVITCYDTFTQQYVNRYCHRKHIPFYISSDGGFIKRKEFFLKRWYKRQLISNASWYFSSGESTNQYLEYYGAKRQNIYMYPFTSVSEKQILKSLVSSEEKINLRKKLGIKEKKIIIGVGQFIKRKGWDVFLNALPINRDDIGAYIIGGEETDEYKEIVSKRKLKNVHFLAFMSSDLLAEYYMASDLFVLPTREDIWGLVINEAMAYGLPVITTDHCIAGLEMVDGNGYIFGINNSDELQRDILSIIDNEQLRLVMSKKSIELSHKWTIENMAKSYFLGLKENLISPHCLPK